MLRRGVPALLLALLCLISAASAAARAEIVREGARPARVEVVVELDLSPAGRAPVGARAKRLATIGGAQRALAARIAAVSPDSEVHWRYSLVLAGVAVVLPAGDVPQVASLPGVRAVYPSVKYASLEGPRSGRATQRPEGPAMAGQAGEARRIRTGREGRSKPAGHDTESTAPRPALDDSPGVIGAPAVWGPNLANAGQGIKIGIIDDGIDQSHRLFDPAGYTMPAGFPKGVTSFTTAKVIVARAFPPPGADWKYANQPFDPENSSHGTHVAGIAAGNPETATPGGSSVSGVAPRAYLGNYKALTVPTGTVGLDGNSPEIVAAIEAAVADGMDVINLSLGEPEVDPARDIVAIALDNAASAGVVSVVAAGNEYADLGRGSINSPASAERAVTVAAVDNDGVLASFSSGGPTPIGFEGKPDVAAPGVDIVSAVPGDRFGELSGTSMSAPHVAGGAALLRQLHPDWTVDQLKSALVLTGKPAWTDGGMGTQAPSARSGGGLVDLVAASAPAVFASPQNLSFGYLDTSTGAATADRSIVLADAGGGSGAWNVSIDQQAPAEGVTVSAPESVVIPGDLTVSASATATATESDQTGFIVLERAGTRVRLPYWFRVTRPVLGSEPFRRLRRTGTFSGTSSGGEAKVTSYRYPDHPSLVPDVLAGPERVYRLQVGRPVANVGAAVVSTARGVRIEPRIVREADENRLVGSTGLPFVANPYLPTFLARSPIVAALLPAPGAYSIVFDTPNRKSAGRFSFRFWIDDTTPPTVRLSSRVARNGRLRARVSDGGAGVDPSAISYRVDGGDERSGRLAAGGGIAMLHVGGLSPGRHRLILRVSDRQEAKNTENVARILPNTRFLETTFRVP